MQPLKQKKLTVSSYLALLLAALLWTQFLAKPAQAEATSVPLFAEQAFNFNLQFVNDNQLTAYWNIAPGYYLYKERFSVTVNGIKLTNVDYPQGDYKYNESGRFEVLTGDIYVPLIMPQQDNQQTGVSVNYQGCAEDGFCYPPITRNYTVNFQNHSIIENTSILPALTNTHPTTLLHTLATQQSGVQHLLTSQHLIMQLLIMMGLGLLLAFTPCVLPMIPILTSIIVGQKNPTTKKAFLLSLTYVFGASITYAMAGAFAALTGSSLQVWLQTPWVIGFVSLLFVMLALSLFGVFDLRLPAAWHNKLNYFSNRQQSGSYPGAFGMGVISTLIVSPCVTAPLVGVLLYIAQTGNVFFGASALFALSIGMGLPLLAIGTSAGKWLPKNGPWMLTMKYVFGVLMIMMAVWLTARTNMWGGSPSQTLAQSGERFTLVRTVAELDQQIAKAKAAQKSVIVDFYADWCESCVSMDKNVFAKPNVKAALANYVVLRADLSANTADDAALLKHTNVIAPPTVLFFSAKNQEKDAARIVGEVNANEFLTRLNDFGQNVAIK